MRLIIFCFTLVFSVSSFAGPKPYAKLKLPRKLAKKKTGNHYLSSNAVFYAPRGVRALLYVPRSKKVDMFQRPLVVYIHGTTRSRNAYKRLGYLKKLARKKSFSVLSVQNMWGLDTRRRDAARGILDTLSATIEFVEMFNENNLFAKDNIFVSGHSSGGLTALSMGIARPDLFRGVGNFKGNFYQDIIDVMMKENKGWRKYYRFGPEVRDAHQLMYFFAFGGKREAARVKKQLPQAKEFVENTIKATVKLNNYPREGHGLSRKNITDFWATVEALEN